MFLLPVMMLLIPSVGRAQDPSHWGVVASVTPGQSWNIVSPLDEYIFDISGGGETEVSSTDFSIGIARGRTLGGDWGVSFVRRTIDDDSRFESVGEVCINNSCVEEIDEFYLTQGVTYTGVEFHKFVPFVTIGSRVQVGMNFAGGVGKFDGQLEKHEFRTEFNFASGQPVPVRTERVTTEQMEEFVSLKPFPLGKVEVAVAGIIAPGIKIRASGGFGFPGYTVFRITGVYLIGAN
jgi:hypothetical protein